MDWKLVMQSKTCRIVSGHSVKRLRGGAFLIVGKDTSYMAGIYKDQAIELMTIS